MGHGGRAEGSGVSTPVKTEPVRRETISSYIQAHTRLEAETWVSVVARGEGLVQDLLKEEGDAVRKGDILLRLEKDQLRLVERQSEVALEQARAADARVKALYERELVSDEEREEASHQLETARVALEQARLNLRFADIRAPLSGVVMIRQVELADMVRPGDEVFAVADLDPLLARVRVPEKGMGLLRLGQMGQIRVDALGGRTFPARVQMINPGVDPQSGTVKVTLELLSSDPVLKPGMFVSVRIITDEHADALIIPKKALVLETDEDDIYVATDGKAERRVLKLGYEDGERVEVMEGVAFGEAVITIGHEGLKNGSAVRVVGADSTAVGVTPPEISQAQTESPPWGRRQRDSGEGRTMPDSSTFMERAKDRGLTEAQAVERWKRMRERIGDRNAQTR